MKHWSRRQTFVVACAIVPTLLAAGCTEIDPGEALIGTWIRTDEGMVQDLFAFGEGGSFRFHEPARSDTDVEEHVTGEYAVEGEILTVDVVPDGRHVRMTYPYYVNDEQFVPGARFPVGDHTGIVGVWHGSLRWEMIDDLGEATPIVNGTEDTEFGADGSFTRRDGSSGEELARGTYAEVWPDFYVALLPGDGLTFVESYWLIDDTAVASNLWWRGQ
jgi:hypothetical protein